MPMLADQTVSASPDFFGFERAQCDLPYYRGGAGGFGLTSVFVVFCATAGAFAVLMKAQQSFHSGLAGFIPPLLFVLIPLIAVAVVAGPAAPLALFRRLGLRDIGIILLFFVLNFILTVVVGLVVSGLFHSVANPAGDMVASASQVDRILFFGWTAVQILGEEVFTILIFLGSMALLVRVMSRKLALCVAALVASVIFGLVHLPTYQWNMPQAFGLMPIRIVLLLPYIITRNIWTSTGVHILNDWAIFGSSALSAMDAG